MRTGSARARGRWALALLAPLVAAGCLRLEGDLRVDDEDRVDGEVVLAVDEQLIAMSGMSLDDLLADSADLGGLQDGARRENYAEDGLVGQRIVFEDVPLDELDARDAGGFFGRDAGGYRFELPLDMGLPLGQGGDLLSGVLDDAELELSVTFPGRVLEDNGTSVEGSTVRWEYQGEQLLQLPDVLAARWDDSGPVGSAGGRGSGRSALIAVLAALALLVAAVAMVALVVRSRRRASAPTSTAGQGQVPAHHGQESATQDVTATAGAPAPAPGGGRHAPGTEPSPSWLGGPTRPAPGGSVPPGSPSPASPAPPVSSWPTEPPPAPPQEDEVAPWRRGPAGPSAGTVPPGRDPVPPTPSP